MLGVVKSSVLPEWRGKSLDFVHQLGSGGGISFLDGEFDHP
jgi:hypothetical protein